MKKLGFTVLALLISTSALARTTLAVDDRREGVIEIKIEGDKARQLFNSLTGVAAHEEHAMGGVVGVVKSGRGIDCSLSASGATCIIKVSTSGDSLSAAQ